MPRVVRQEPLVERIKAYLNPLDFLLWLSEELHESAWEEALQDWAIPIGAGANLLFIITRANSRQTNTRSRDDVFGDFDGRAGTGWFTWLVRLFSSVRSCLVLTNDRRLSRHICWLCLPS